MPKLRLLRNDGGFLPKVTDAVRDCWEKPSHRHCEGQIGLVGLKQSPERLLHSIPELRLIRNDGKGLKWAFLERVSQQGLIVLEMA